MKVEFSLRVVEKHLNIKFHENQSSRRRDEANSLFLQFCESAQKDFKKIIAHFVHQFLQHFIPHNMDVVERITIRQWYEQL